MLFIEFWFGVLVGVEQYEDWFDVMFCGDCQESIDVLFEVSGILFLQQVVQEYVYGGYVYFLCLV